MAPCPRAHCPAERTAALLCCSLRAPWTGLRVPAATWSASSANVPNGFLSGGPVGIQDDEGGVHEGEAWARPDAITIG